MKWIVILLLLTSCSTNRLVVTKQNRFKFQACTVVYCESSEFNIAKNAGLKIIELVVSIKGGGVSLGRGFCEEYYQKRRINSGYVWSKKTAKEVCEEKN